MIPIKLADLGEPSDATPPDPESLVADGMVYRATLAVEEVQPGLLRLQLEIQWDHFGPEPLGSVHAAALHMERVGSG